jgi:hypothetical protein
MSKVRVVDLYGSHSLKIAYRKESGRSGISRNLLKILVGERGADSGESDQCSWLIAITVPAIPIRRSERSDAGEMIVEEVIAMGQEEPIRSEAKAGDGWVETSGK